MNKETARAALDLYGKLAGIDAQIESMSTAVDPLQSVKFYHRTACYSGPLEYTPVHKRATFVRLIIQDMKIERATLVKAIRNIGFEA